MAGTAIQSIAQYRPYLFAIAYRMLGSAVDAEDIVQEAFLRWQEAEPEDIESPKAYLATITTRLCIDHLRSARVQRETYIGPWLPEPVVVDETGVDVDPAMLAESLSLAFLALLERLNPLERAVFLLHDVFGYSFDEIAPIVGRTPAACRKIAQRARERIRDSRPRFRPSSEERERLTRQFATACATGNLPGLIAVLADDVMLWSDGGDRALAARRPLRGAETVARFLLGVVAKAPPDLTARIATINGEPALIAESHGSVLSVTVPEVADERITELRIVVNPDKLGSIAAIGSPIMPDAGTED